MENHHIIGTGEGLGAVLLAVFSHLWVVVFPLMTSATAILGFVLAVHGVWNLLRYRGPQPVIIHHREEK